MLITECSALGSNADVPTREALYLYYVAYLLIHTIYMHMSNSNLNINMNMQYAISKFMHQVEVITIQ